MMEKAFECALLLKEKHENLANRIAISNASDNIRKLRLKQNTITQQIILFLEEIQEFKSIFMLNKKLKNDYVTLVNYFSKEIYTRINQFQMQLNFLQFEHQITSYENESNYFNSNASNIQLIEHKLKLYYQLFKNDKQM